VPPLPERSSQCTTDPEANLPASKSSSQKADWLLRFFQSGYHVQAAHAKIAFAVLATANSSSTKVTTNS
jgi:hypothetical protein